MNKFLTVAREYGAVAGIMLASLLFGGFMLASEPADAPGAVISSSGPVCEPYLPALNLGDNSALVTLICHAGR